jgi:hypothetical protein
MPSIALFVAVLAISGCAQIKVYDVEVCANLGYLGAHCNHTLIDKERDISPELWPIESFGWLCMKPKAFNDTETAIDQFCASYPGICDYQTRETFRMGFARISKVVKKTGKLRQ